MIPIVSQISVIDKMEEKYGVLTCFDSIDSINEKINSSAFKSESYCRFLIFFSNEEKYKSISLDNLLQENIAEELEYIRITLKIEKENFYLSKNQKPTTNSIIEFLQYADKSEYSNPKSDKLVRLRYDKENKTLNLFYCNLYSGNFYKMKKCILDCSSEKNKFFAEEFMKYYAVINPAVIGLYILGKWYAERKENIYKYYTIPKKDGGTREIYEPIKDVKGVCRIFLKAINRIADKRKFYNQYAFLHKKSVFNNAFSHIDIYKSEKRYFFKTDIKSFFNYCRFDTIKGIFNTFINCYNSLENYFNPTGYEIYRRNFIRNEGFYDAIKYILINPVTKGFYQGNPLSGALSNFCLREALSHAEKILHKEEYSIELTAYADDICISSGKPITKERAKNFERILLYAFREHNLQFTLKKEKTHINKNNAVQITGVIINHENRITVPRKIYRLLRSCVERIEHKKKLDMSQESFNGLLQWAIFIDKSKTSKILNLKERLEKVGYYGGEVYSQNF